MPSYKLIYFKGLGRGEAARMLFALAGQEFEDQRLEREEWLKLKPSTPFGQLPILEVDGKMIAQSTAIYRLLAKRFGYYGDDDLEQTRGDMFIESFTDIGMAMQNYFYVKDETFKAELAKTFQEETLPAALQNLENLVEGNGYFLTKLSWVDVVFLQLWAFFDYAKITIDLSKYEKLKKIIDNVQANPKIAEYIKNRPAPATS